MTLNKMPFETLCEKEKMLVTSILFPHNLNVVQNMTCIPLFEMT